MPFCVRCRDQFAFRIAHQKAVFVLRRHDRPRCPLRARSPQRSVDPAGRQIGAADGAHLALLSPDRRARAAFPPSVFSGRACGADRDRSNRSCSRFRLASTACHDVGARARVLCLSSSSIAMPNLVASTMSLRRAPKISPSCVLGAAAIAIDVGGVEQRDAGSSARSTTRREASISQHAEIVAAEADDRNLDAGLSELAFFHMRSSPISLSPDYERGSVGERAG